MDTGRLLNALDQVARHGVCKRLTTDSEVDLRARAGKKHGSLSGRVASTHDHHRSACASLGLHLGRGVIDADALEVREAVQCQAVVARAGGDDDGTRVDYLAIVEADLMRVNPRTQRDRLAAQLDAHPELVSLQRCSCRQLFARQAGWKS